LVKGTEQYLCIKIGIVKLEGRNESIERLLKAAMVSLNFVRRNGSEHFAFFDEEMEKRLVRDDQIENELRTELSGSGSQSLYLEYQPVVNGKTNDITGFEALVRMRSTHLGQIPPVEFIDVAERRQLILPLGMWVLRKVCAFIRRLNARGRSGVAVAVNISGLQLLRDDFIPTVLELIKANGIDGSSIVFEITESVLLDNYDLINRRLNELREHGIRITLDDFGTGYSSFSRLSELNIDIVKIDKFFIDRIRRKERGALITGTIISIAHQLGLSVVAEGVEIEQQRRYLMNEGCDLMQGFLFSKSLSETDAFSSLEIGSIETMFSSIRD
jgi:EAL domain-containing protein (putative c-di-GMP-specific phosphodiesterase class I)